MAPRQFERPLTSGEVAQLFNVTPEAVAGWVKQGKLRCFETPGGRRRFRRADVDSLLAQGEEGAA